jgi:serine protease Do
MTPGTHVQLGILRNGSSQTVTITLGEYNKSAEQVASNGTAGEGSNGGKLGLGMADLTPDVRQQLNLPDSVKGAAIQSVRPGSPAEEAGLQPGDVIVEVNRHATDSASSVVNSVRAVPTGKDVLLLVWSGGGEGYRVLHPDQG